MAPLDLERHDELDEADVDDFLEGDFTKDGIKQKVKMIEEVLKGAVADANKQKSGYRAMKDLTQVYLQYLDWLDKHPDEPKDINTNRDFKRFREAVFEYVGPEGMTWVMALYDYRYGTAKEKEEAKKIINDEITEKKMKSYLKKRMNKWQGTLSRWL